MKLCNLGDQSQFETSNLSGHWININNALLLGFLVPNNGDSWHFRFPHGLLVNMSLLVLFYLFLFSQRDHNENKVYPDLYYAIPATVS